eukprot:8115168-Pyramimonas_sp.AAC.1
MSSRPALHRSLGWPTCPECCARGGPQSAWCAAGELTTTSDPPRCSRRRPHRVHKQRAEGGRA